MRLEQHRANIDDPCPEVCHMRILGMAQNYGVCGVVEIDRVVCAGMQAVEDEWQALAFGPHDGKNTGDGFGHSVPPSCRWQAVPWSPSVILRGASRRQRGPAMGQRG